MDNKTSRAFVWTEPGEIEGTPEEVRELTLRQLGELAEVVAEVVERSAIQIRSADLGDILSRRGPKGDDAAAPVDEWDQSPRGEAVTTLKNTGAEFIRSVKDLLVV